MFVSIKLRNFSCGSDTKNVCESENHHQLVQLMANFILILLIAWSLSGSKLNQVSKLSEMHHTPQYLVQNVPFCKEKIHFGFPSLQVILIVNVVCPEQHSNTLAGQFHPYNDYCCLF
ncbi:hypothetical protein AAZV13_06G263400 [Glycine max]